MNKELRVSLILLGLIIAVLPSIVMIIGSEEIVVGEQLCVDGNNNINLEGLMCEKTESITFGLPPGIAVIIQATIGISGVIIFGMSLFAKVEDSE